MDKDQLIAQQAVAARKKIGTGPSRQLAPNLDFKGVIRQIILATEDIKKQSKSSFLLKMKQSITGDDQESKGGHRNGRVLADLVAPKLNKEVAELTRDPNFTQARVQLIRGFLQIPGDYEIDVYRDLVVQAALPIYLGDITPASMQLAGQAYRFYINQVIHMHKKQLLLVRSDQLKNVNVDRISTESLIGPDKVPESPEEADMIREIKMGLRLQEMTKNLDEDIRGAISMPLNLEELDGISSQHGAVMQFLGGEVGQTYNKRKLVLRKSYAVLDVIRYIPFLHSLGLKMSGRLQEVEGKMPAPYLMEARIQMQAVRFMMLRLQCEDLSARDSIGPTFNKAIVAYRKALRRTSTSDPQRSDLPVLAEFAQIAYFAFQNRELIRATKDGIHEILKLAKKTIDAAVLVNPRYNRLQMKIQMALNQIEKKGRRG
jgi:hypothetical protein